MNRFEAPEPGSKIGPGPELADRLDEKVVILPCYEPSSLQVDISARALTTHTLVIGQTGAGKTTSALRWFLKSLIGHSRDESTYRPGIFIFDLNADDTVGLVRKWAAEYGRSEDVRLLTADAGHLDLFAHVRTLEDLPAATAQFFHGAWTDDSDNGYWQETTRTLIDAALSICLIVRGRLETDMAVRFLMNWLVAKRPSPDDTALLTGFEAMAAVASGRVNSNLLGKIEHVRATIDMWNKLDPRTKGILNSCLLDALGPLISLETRRYLDPSRGLSFVPEEIVSGKIMVFSLSAGRNLESASLLGRILKSRLYVALQGRPQVRNQRLCVILADEYHYLASGGTDRASDVTALATLRSRSVGLVAGTQSLDHLASAMTARQLRSLLPNFGNHIFYRSTEANTSAFATLIMGSREKVMSSDEEAGDIMLGSGSTKSREYICPPGALACLEPFQAYVSLSTGYRSPGVIWLGANLESPGAFSDREPTSTSDPLTDLRDAVFPPPKTKPQAKTSRSPVVTADWPYSDKQHYYDEPTWHRIIGARRFQRTSYSTFRAFRQHFANWGHRPEGLESLPLCWWDAVARMSIRFGQQHQMKILSLLECKGCLEIIISDLTDPTPLYLEWIAQMHCSIYPTRTRRLKRRDQRLIDSWGNDEELPVDADEPQEEGKA